MYAVAYENNSFFFYSKTTSMRLRLEFSGGSEQVVGKQRFHNVEVPAASCSTVRHLLQWMLENIVENDKFVFIVDCLRFFIGFFYFLLWLRGAVHCPIFDSKVTNKFTDFDYGLCSCSF